MGIKSVLFETFLATSVCHNHRWFRETYSYVDIETYNKIHCFIPKSQRVIVQNAFGVRSE